MRATKNILRFVLAAIFISAGFLHLTRPEFFVAIVPPYLPYPQALVAISGLAEIILGFALLIRCWIRLAGWGLIALLIAVFPANIHMAVHPELFPSIPRWALLCRLPIQGVLIAWAWWYTRANKEGQ